MRFLTTIILLCIISGSSFGQSVFINEYFNTTSKDNEWVELVTTEDIDMRGMKLRDHTGTGTPQTPLIFSQNNFWSSVPSGTIIVIMGSTVTVPEDLDATDGVVVVSVTNAAYISGNAFNIANASDALQLLDATDNHIHGLSHGSGNASTLPEPKAHFTGSSTSNQSVGFQKTTQLNDISADEKVGVISPTLGQGNDTDNSNLIFSFKEPVDEATMKLESDGVTLTDGSEIAFGSIFTGEDKSIRFTVTNLGKAPLDLTNLRITAGTDFIITEPFSLDQLDTFDISEFEITFRPSSAGEKEGEFSFTTNDQASPNVSITLTGTALEVGESQPIAEVRQLALGSIVSVSGRVTVANEFGGPVYLQDATGGLSVFYPALHSAVQIGDSVKVTGPLAEFGTTTSGKGLLQISGENVTFTKYDVQPVIPQPKELTIAEISEIHQSVLILIRNVTLTGTGTFQGNRNYDITDETGTTQIRIDGDVSSLVGATIPSEPINLTAVVSRYGGSNQLMPRQASDLNVEAFELPYADVPDTETLDIVTWNLEWFGSSSNGPEDDNLQIENVATVLRTINADLYALQEISSVTAFNSLVSKLEGYRGFIAPINQTQKTAYVFKPSVIDSLSSSFLSTNWSTANAWANGRYPYEFVGRVNLNGETRTIFFLNIHAKALSDPASYQRRVDDALDLKDILDNQRASSNGILLGDYNDYVTKTTYEGSTISPYAPFVNDSVNYKILTKTLEEKGQTSYSRFSMLDHIMISNELFDEYLEGTEVIENPVYIGSYLTTTSDHFPVKARLRWGTATSTNETESVPHLFSLSQNYPNPFNPTTRINFTLPSNGRTSLTIYSVMGQKIATPITNSFYSAGTHTVTVDASRWASGNYIYVLETASGQRLANIMTLIK